MQQSRFFSFLLLFLFFLMFVACDTEDPFRIEPPDFSTVPEPFDTSSVEAITVDDGVRAYIYDEGYGSFSVTLRDQVNIYLTLRTESGEIIYSTFSNARVSPVSVSMSVADGRDSAIHQSINSTPGGYTQLLAYTPGLKEGLLGMKTGEKRTLVVQPEMGYQNIPQNSANGDYTDSVLIYDIRISAISPTKSQ